MRRLHLVLLLLILVLSSCSTLNHLAVSSSSGLLVEASGNMETETNFEITRAALIPNLKLIEGLLSQAPQNSNLLFTLTKGYTGLAFMINESDMFEEEWSGKKSEENKRQALNNYTRAYGYGLRYLKSKNVDEIELFKKTDKVLSDNLTQSQLDLEAVLFTAQSLGGMINLQKDNISLVAQLSVVKAMFDWACSRKPELNFGACDIFYGAYESGRPKMLGGNPEKGKEYFLHAINLYPNNWLIRTSYIQMYLIPFGDEDGFNKEMSLLEKYNEEFKSFNIFSLPKREEPLWSKDSHLSIYQALAIKRYELLNRYRKQFF